MVVVSLDVSFCSNAFVTSSISMLLCVRTFLDFTVTVVLEGSFFNVSVLGVTAFKKKDRGRMTCLFYQGKVKN